MFSIDCATTTLPKPDGSAREITRKSEPGASIVKGRSPYSATFAGVIPVK